MSFQVAIDGPAGAGKSTIAKMVAAKMGLIYVDTGAMYRAIALYLLRSGIDCKDSAAVETTCKGAGVTIAYENGVQIVYLNGENVNAYLRTEEVGNTASVTSANPAVRAQIFQLQRDLANSSDCIMDGRDIGTVVLPDAQVKIFLTASAAVRAKRRQTELMEKGQEADYATILADIEKRDEQDRTRAVSPLKQAEDAILLDTSDLGIDEVVAQICQLCKR